jgi:hypothetical protein
VAARHFYVNYDVLRARSKGRLPNLSRGGKNKNIADKEEETLKLYYTCCILVGDPLERKYIEAAANSILRAVGKKSVSKPWLSRWLKRHKDFLKPRFSKPLAVERKASHEY